MKTPVGQPLTTTTTSTITASPSPSPIPSLSISPASASIGIGQSQNFQATGGVPPYNFVANSGSVVQKTPTGGVTGSLGAFTAPLTPQTSTLTLQDSLGTTVQATITSTVGTTLSPNDTYFSQQTDMYQSSSSAHIHAPQAWAIQTDCSSVPVGVLDTGVDMGHPDLLSNIWTNPHEIAANGIDDDGNGYKDDVHGWNFVAGTNNPADDNFHGTHVAGTIGAIGNNSTGVAGICWKAAIVPLKFLNSSGAGVNSDAITAIYYAATVGVKVINASFGGGAFTQTFKDALDYAANNDIVFVAAAGNSANDNDASPTYPANYASASVISVAAVDSTDTLASFSNYGATTVVIAAPGVSILSTTPRTQTSAMQTSVVSANYDVLNGTSMAAPHVAGVATLYKSLDPTQSATAIKSRIISKGDVITGLNTKVSGSKRLNARSTLY